MLFRSKVSPAWWVISFQALKSKKTRLYQAPAYYLSTILLTRRGDYNSPMRKQRHPLHSLYSLSLLCPLLSSCALLPTITDTAVELETKTLSAYSLLDENGETVSSLKQRRLGQVDAQFLSGQELIPYLSLKQYASLFEPFLKEDYRSEVEENTLSATWLIHQKTSNGEEEPLIFAAAISFSSGEIYVGGSFSSASAVPSLIDTDALTYHSELKQEVVNLDDAANLNSYAYSTKDFASYKKGSARYLPLGLYDIAFSDALDFHACYDYENILVFDSYSSLESPLAEGEERNGPSALERTKTRLNGMSMPSYLASYNRNCFYFLMDNFYGLHDTLGISSMRSHYINSTYADDFLSSDPATRQYALSRALYSLNDGHTGLLNTASIWGENASDGYGVYGMLYDRSFLRASLAKARQAFLEENGLTAYDVAYSTSGKTAYFSFNSFSFASSLEELLNEEKDGYGESAYRTDTCALLIRQMESIKAKGGVEDVIIDISTNGGGTIGVLFRILALLSENNSAVGYYCDTNRNAIIKLESSFDSNLDGEYDRDDVYGDDFHIYLLTSPYSFSCGNALPYFASYNGFAKCIGAKSGGGECFVGTHMLPNFQEIAHSSNGKFGTYDESMGLFQGVESGAKIDYAISYFDYFNLDFIENTINPQ